MTTTLLLLLAFACGGEAAHDPGDHEHGPGADHTHDAPAAAPPGAAADLHAGHSDHMADMARTREGFRATLGAAYDAPVAGLDAADAAKGAEHYAAHCASCHGAAGKGDGAAGAGLNPPPADLTDAFHARYYSDAARVHIIRNGIEGTAMAGFSSQLDDAAVLDLYAFVRAFRGQPTAAPPSDHGDHH